LTFQRLLLPKWYTRKYFSWLIQNGLEIVLVFLWYLYIFAATTTTLNGCSPFSNVLLAKVLAKDAKIEKAN